MRDRIRHEVEVGDELMVYGNLFVITELTEELNKPAVLTVKTPLELYMEVVERP